MLTRRKKRRLPQDHLTVKITGLSHDGRGIAHVNGKITFIDNALPGEVVSFKYNNSHRSFDEAEAIHIIESSPVRTPPTCSNYYHCGGCILQHLSHQEQIKHKQATLLNQLKHFGNIQPEHLLPPMLSDQIYGYRYRARFGVRHLHKKPLALVGFREKNGRFITDMQSCAVLHPSIGSKLLRLRETVSALSCANSIPQIELAVGTYQTALIFKHLVDLTTLDKEKLCAFGKHENIDIYLQPGEPESTYKIWPKDTPEHLSYFLPEYNLEYHFKPYDFTQINLPLNEKMVHLVIQELAPKRDETILDLFSGLGNFTLPAALYAKQVTGIEVCPNMTKRGESNAALNNIHNCDFYAFDLNEPLNKAPWTARNYDKILLDPPRTGAENIIKQLPKFNPKRIVYVSCNPATLARDGKELVFNQRYRLIKAGILDMFPHTSHVESIAVFEK